MKRYLSVLIFCITILSDSIDVHAQDKIKFGAYGRAYQQINRLDKKDTLNIDNTSKGQVLMDLGIKINPDRKTEIQSVIRMKSDLGGFYTNSNIAELRQLYVKGILGNFLSYQVGDIFLKMTPYTMYNNYAELNINEAAVFKDLRNDYVYYENRNKGNSWWQQGAHTNFSIGTKTKLLQTMNVDGFLVRNRTTDYLSTPTTFQAGGRVMLVQSARFRLGFNYLNLFDVGATYGSKLSTRNPVQSYETEIAILNSNQLALQLNGEAGFSQLNFINDPSAPKNNKGNFIDAGLKAAIKSANLTLKANYSYTSPQFYSSAAQTKRVVYGKSPSIFPVYGNDPYNTINRSINAYDIVRDPTIYNVNITPLLMNYNPVYGNALPFGKATPNRKGVTMELNYKDSLERVNINLNGSYLMEAVPTDAAKGRTFLVGTIMADIYLNKFIHFNKKILLHGGARMESTNRAGDSLSAVKLSTQIYDGGLEVELLNKFDLLMGLKLINSKGTEYLALRNGYNQIINYDFTSYKNINYQELMLGYGIKYRFSKATYLTAQYHTYTLKDNNYTNRSFNMNQFYILFNMNF